MHFPGFKILGGADRRTRYSAACQLVGTPAPCCSCGPITEEPMKYTRMSHAVAAASVFHGCTRPAFGACIKYFKF